MKGLSEGYFLYNNLVWKLYNSGPIYLLWLFSLYVTFKNLKENLLLYFLLLIYHLKHLNAM